MQELNCLLEYIDYYEYDKEAEEIRILPGPNAESVKEQYDKARRIVGAWYPPTPEAETRYKESASWKRWPLDVAIDCIKHMDENDKDYIVHHLQTSEYHFGYAMAIRNKYICFSTKYNSLSRIGIQAK